MDAHDVAIVGMACVFPKAPDLATYWRNLRDGVDAITPVPAGRWDARYYDRHSKALDRVYVFRGGFIDDYASIDPAAHGLMPLVARGAEPEQLLALEVATAALVDAGYADRDFPRERSAVIIGRGNHIGPATMRAIELARGSEQLIGILRRLVPGVDDAQLASVKAEFQKHCGPFGPDTAIGLVPNLTASRIANRLDLGGSAYTVDAACASTLLAVEQACSQLRNGQADLVICGGLHICQDITFYSVFTQLGALSRSEQIRPFDRRADGLLIGEGVGMLVLKRLPDARRSDDRIYAVIRGIASASDGRDTSVMKPSVEGQVLALTRAWRDAGLDGATLGLVEAHGTGTAAGDQAEIQTLGRIFGAATPFGERVPLGSVKSMIGHAMPAAGAAGLIKAALAIHHGIRPPTLHCDEPHPALGQTRFRVIAKAEPWSDAQRVAGVNAFGFGGINAHAVLAGPAATTRRSRANAARPAAAKALLIAANDKPGLLDALAAERPGGAGPWRAALFDPTPKRAAVLRGAIESGRPRAGRDGIYFSSRGLVTSGGRIAFLFPGVEAAFEPNVEDIARHFQRPAPPLDARNLELQGGSVGLLNMFLHDVLRDLGVAPDAIAGHSLGEWCGMMAAGMLGDTGPEDLLATLQPGTSRVADVAYVAAGAGVDKLAKLIEGLPDVRVSHDNCVHQSIVCVPASGVDALLARLREAHVIANVLPFQSGFHTPELQAHQAWYAEQLAPFALNAPIVPLWSATTCAPYPHHPAQIRALFLDHLVKPVRFRELIAAMHRDGVRVFVQVGIGSLCAFVDDVLARDPHHAIAVAGQRRPGMEQLQRACAALWVEGASVDLQRVGLADAAAHAGSGTRMRLSLGLPLIEIDHPPIVPPSARPTPPAFARAGPRSELLQVFDACIDEIAQAQAAVAQAIENVAPARARATQRERTDRLLVSVDTFPELLDHTLIPQPPKWPELSDRAPTVPMTMSIALMTEAARRLDPGRIALGVEQVVARKWLFVEPPVEIEIHAQRIDADRIRVAIGRNVEGVVQMGNRYPDPPPPQTEGIGSPLQFPVARDAIYRDGWMFHGPLYQGIVAIDRYGERGVHGRLVVLPAKGALLDAVGQLFGLSIAQRDEDARLAMPVKAGRIEFFGPDPPPGTALECTVWIRHVGRREARADMEVVRSGRVYARVRDWEDWRFFTGGAIFGVMRQPDRSLLASAQPEGFVVVDDPRWTSATLEFLSRRYVGARELDAMGGLAELKRHSDWLLGRIAAKDAVRKLLFDAGHEPMFPLEVAISNDSHGRPLVSGPFQHDIRVSIAHKSGIAVAIAAEGVDPGIDIEKIDPRGEGFASLAFHADEVALAAHHEERDASLTRLWCAKEAVGKALGRGLSGNPKSLRVTRREGDRLMVQDRWVGTRLWRDHVIAWTLP